MMTINLIIFPGYYVPHVGGLETHVDEFVKYLSEDKEFNIYIFAPNIPKYEEFEVRYNNVKVYRYPAFEVISNYPVPNILSIKFWRMFFSLYKINFHVVMTRTRFFSNTLLGFLFAKLRLSRVKLVHVEHGSAFVNVSSRLTNKIAYIYDKTIGKLIFRESDCVIAISKSVKKFILENFLDDLDIPVIYRGIEIQEIENIPEDREIKERFKDKIKLCFVGRLYKWKGVDNLIESYKILPKEIRDRTVLIIVGYGEDLEYLKELSGEYLNKGIYFTGRKDFKKAIGIVKSCDIYIHPSYRGGGLSTSLLQAMCCGKPVVASPYEGGDEVVVDRKTGILLKDNSPEEICRGVMEFIESRELMVQCGRNARRFIEENFNWKVSVERYKEILRDLVKG
ncbi:glycosyltransferase [Methanofervidicoccus sp. A16]|uniref:glycosyltransferase family 4 protein n=1 Tax=Methanofervidicoccus sp. A16 TaxID=2607662 RepID=UPI001188944B|nr:glycosyltransferase family 4 protein [Methanofervidicoccus sp. A16]AXI24949.1 glycosyltransferase [Methanofervidicoccus sp. A16]